MLEESETFVWVTVSCFYPMKAWHKLLRQIEVLLISIPFKESFDISISSELGENIRLSVFVPEARYSDTVVYIDSFITAFFEKDFYPSITSRVESTKLPYPSSIVQFNLYKKSLSAEFFINENKYLSDCILKALDSEVEYDSVVAFSSYLHLCLLHECLKFSRIEVISECFLSLSKLDDDKLFKIQRKESKAYIRDIFLEIADEEFLKKNYMWLYSWKSQIHNKLSSMMDASNFLSDPMIQAFFLENSSLIKAKVNLNRGLTLLMEFLIYDIVNTLIAEERVK